MAITKVLLALRPVSRDAVMNLVEKAGIDVSSWAIRKDGSEIDNPKANQSKIYEWGFGGNAQPIAICLWHDALNVEGENITYKDNLRQHAVNLDRAANTPENPAGVKIRARDQAQRARKVDGLFQEAFRKSIPVRVILLEGDSSGLAVLGWQRSTAKARELDSLSWYVHDYDIATGDVFIVRDVKPNHVKHQDISSEQEIFKKYSDQFSIPRPLTRNESTTNSIARDPKVRADALSRASGFCEYCQQKGFQTEAGGVYLETHHVIPLSENGPDEVWNVAALCPKDHRRAHFELGRAMITSSLKDYLCAKHPQYSSLIREWHSSVKGEK